jgi:subtilisin family serine protease
MAGSELTQKDFTGVAPLSELVVVKLKEAKESLRQYYGIGADKGVYQENDIMLGIKYLQSIARERKQPLVMMVGLGSNAGNHSGELPLSRYLGKRAIVPGVAVVSSGGNEGARNHHYQKINLPAKETDTVEVRIAEGETGATIELWTKAPQLFTVELRSPLGNSTGKIPIWYGKGGTPITFPYENSRIFVEYTPVETNTGDEVVVMRFLQPTPGIWRILVTNETQRAAGYHLWLPVEGFLKADTVFLKPEPEVTVCEPGNTRAVLTATAYDHVNGGIYLYAGRGFSSSGEVEPDLAAPGVKVYGPVQGGGFSTKSGTSVGAAFCAGVAALMLEWGIVNGNNPAMQTTEIKNTLIRGADREDMEYPNPVWGYGKLNAYKAFGQLRPGR